MEDIKHEKVQLLESCQSCGKALKETWKFCPFCETEIVKYNCPFCGKEVKHLWEFCPYCKGKFKNFKQIGLSFGETNDWLKIVLDHD